MRYIILSVLVIVLISCTVSYDPIEGEVHRGKIQSFDGKCLVWQDGYISVLPHRIDGQFNTQDIYVLKKYEHSQEYKIIHLFYR